MKLKTNNTQFSLVALSIYTRGTKLEGDAMHLAQLLRASFLFFVRGSIT